MVNMVTITNDIKKMIGEKDAIIVGTVDQLGICNISPRSTYHVTDKAIYWYELFEHKSFQNFSNNPWISVAVFDTTELNGYQLKGKASILVDEEEYYHIKLKILDRLKKQGKRKILDQVNKQPFKIIKFTPKAIFTLRPHEYSDLPGVLEADPEIGKLMCGVDFEKYFGYSKKCLE